MNQQPMIDELAAALRKIADDGSRVEFARNKRVQHHAQIARAALARYDAEQKRQAEIAAELTPEDRAAIPF